MTSVSNHLRHIHARIDAAAMASGRGPHHGVKLIAVSKFHPVDAVRAALDAGHRVFGENRVQEAKGKFTDLRAACPDLELHLIGPLQTNKAEDAVKLFDVIQTLDRPALAEALAKAMRKTGCKPRFYVEVNSGNESQKAGIAPEELGGFLTLCRDQYALEPCGLMCIPPLADDPAPHFARLRELAAAHNLPHLSMGMSGDFEAAISEGATDIRIGTAIFGERPETLRS